MIENKYINKEDFVKIRVDDDDKEQYLSILDRIYSIKWDELNMDTDKRDMEIENKIYNYFDELTKSYQPGLSLANLNFLYRYITLDEYFSMPLDLKAEKMDKFFHEQEEIIDENISIVRKRLSIEKIAKEVDDWLKLNPDYLNNNTPGSSPDAVETFSNNVYERLNKKHTDGFNDRQELINIRYGEIMRDTKLSSSYVTDEEVLESYNYQTARSVINLLRERSSSLSLDKQKIILEAIRNNIVERFCSKDDCRIHFKDVVDQNITLNTPFKIIKNYHMKHHIDEIHMHSSIGNHLHYHTDKQKKTIHKHEHDEKEAKMKAKKENNLLNIKINEDINIQTGINNFISNILEPYNNLDSKYANF